MHAAAIKKGANFDVKVIYISLLFSKAHTKDAKEWLSTFENRTEVTNESGSPTEFSHLRSGEASGPVLVCMTFADRVLAEVLENCSIGEAKTRVASHFEVPCSLSLSLSLALSLSLPLFPRSPLSPSLSPMS